MASIRELAAEYDVDGGVVESVDGDLYRPVVSTDRRAGADRGVDATPTVFVDGDPVEPTVEAISSKLEKALDCACGKRYG